MKPAPSFICFDSSFMAEANKNGERVIDLLARRSTDPFPDLNAVLLDIHAEAAAWVEKNPTAEPPRVIAVLPAAWSGTPPVEAARSINALTTTGGSVTLWFILAGQGPAVLFPSTSEELPRASSAQRLFPLASELPPQALAQAAAEGFAPRPHARALLVADLAKLPEFVRFYLTTTS